MKFHFLSALFFYLLSIQITLLTSAFGFSSAFFFLSNYFKEYIGNSKDLIDYLVSFKLSKPLNPYKTN